MEITDAELGMRRLQAVKHRAVLSHAVVLYPIASNRGCQTVYLRLLVGAFVLRQDVQDLLDHTSASDNFKGRDSMPYTLPYVHTATCC